LYFVLALIASMRSSGQSSTNFPCEFWLPARRETATVMDDEYIDRIRLALQPQLPLQLTPPPPPPPPPPSESYLQIEPVGARLPEQLWSRLACAALNGWHAYLSPSTYFAKRVSDGLGEGIRDAIGSLAYVWSPHAYALVASASAALALALVAAAAAARAGGRRGREPEQDLALLELLERRLRNERRLEAETTRADLVISDLRAQKAMLENGLLDGPPPPVAGALALATPDDADPKRKLLLQVANGHRAGSQRKKAVQAYLREHGLDLALYETVRRDSDLKALNGTR
jgi:hypothetical protein